MQLRSYIRWPSDTHTLGMMYALPARHKYIQLCTLIVCDALCPRRKGSAECYLHAYITSECVCVCVCVRARPVQLSASNNFELIGPGIWRKEVTAAVINPAY